MEDATTRRGAARGAQQAVLVEEGVEFGEQGEEAAGVGKAVEFADGLGADTAASGEIVGGYSFADARQEDELKPLAESHGVHSEGFGEFQLLRAKRFGLPHADTAHLGFDEIHVTNDVLLKFCGGHGVSARIAGIHCPAREGKREDAALNGEAKEWV